MKKNLRFPRCYCPEYIDDVSSTYFPVNIWSEWDKCTIDGFSYCLTYVYWERERKSKVVIFFLLDYVWERVLGNAYVRIVLINDWVSRSLLSSE